MQTRIPKPAHMSYFKWSGFFLFMLALLVLASLLGIVKVQHEIRHVESRYYQTMQQTLVAKEEWGRLMLEKKHLTSPTMVEQVASEQLEMTLNKSNFEYIYLQPIDLYLGYPNLHQSGKANSSNNPLNQKEAIDEN
mgnify:FL=1